MIYRLIATSRLIRLARYHAELYSLNFAWVEGEQLYSIYKVTLKRSFFYTIQILKEQDIRRQWSWSWFLLFWSELAQDSPWLSNQVLTAFFVSAIFIYELDVISGELGGFYCSSIGSIIILIRVVILVKVIVLIKKCWCWWCWYKRP